MKSLADGECGQANALVNLAQNYGNSNQRMAPGTSRGASSLLPSFSQGEQFANEYLQKITSQAVMPNTFSMNALASQLPKQSSSTSLASNWSNEFAAKPANPLAAQWSQQYSTSRPSFENAWSGATGTSNQYQLPHSSSSVDSAMWSSEFLDNVDTSLQSSQLSNGMSDSWADEYGHLEQQPDMWKQDMRDMMESEWESIRRNVEMAQGDSISKGEEMEYTHQNTNPYLNSLDPMTEGDTLMRAGDLGNAMLAYEAAVQKNPQDADTHDLLEAEVERNPLDADAWCRLGLSHAENEHDQKAIKAFTQCLNIQPNNQEALLSLSVSLANESQESRALDQLERWIVAHQGGDPTTIQKDPMFGYSGFIDPINFKRIEEQFLNAARQQGGTTDAALQNSLGVLYNLVRDFDRAVECINLAIASRPEDPRLWNRLGATLANGDKTVPAISAYREALQRYPTYVRARYNLGISCMHLHSYREACEHFASALELQKGDSSQSAIWSTMRSAAIRMQGAPDDILPALDSRDLAAFKRALQQTPQGA